MMMGAHPLYMMMAIVALGGGLWSLHQHLPEALPWVFVAGLVGTIVRVLYLRREDAHARGEGQVDHRSLRERRVEVYRDWIKGNVRGQDAAIDSVVDALKRGLELAGPGRSPGSFLLVGPTGTGKTFLATIVAQALWPEKEPIVLHMNQYKSPGDVAAILGSPSRHDDALMSAVREDACRVVLLDEIDKCHPEVLHALFGPLDGRLSRDMDQGTMVDFSGCVFFATCNAGAAGLRALRASGAPDFASKAREVLAREGGFERALLARFSEIVLMDTLAPMSVAEIACLHISKQWREQGIEVAYLAPELLARAVKLNSEFGEYGVRQLAHCLRRLTDPLLDEARKNGSSRVAMGLDAPSGAAKLMPAWERE